MAQYHFHASILKRSEGHSVVASAAYRAGERLYDSRIGYAFDYRRRSGILHTEIMAPDNTPDWMLDRFQLWNGVEKAEERKDSQLARSIDISLMCELTFDQNLEILRDFVKKTWIDQGMLADIAIHAPGHDSDERNVHAHILLTMRVITADGFGNKQREWNDRKDFKQWRKAWADFANAALERGGFAERIDHRSLVEQGLDREPTIRVGPSGKQIEHRGKNSDRAQKNRDIEAANDNMADLKKELAESEQRLAELRRQLAAERMEQIQKIVRAADAVWDRKLRPSTMLGYRDMFRKYVKPRAGNIRLRDFHTKDGRHLFDRISEEVPNLSHTTLMHVKALMSGIFTYARQEDAVREANPMQGVKAEGRRYKPTRETYSLNEISVMLPKIPEPARTIVMVAAFSGLRASEIRGLRWEDYTGTELRVVRSVWRTHIGRTKTEESAENPVPVIPVLRRALDEHRMRYTGNGFIFAGERKGKPLNLENLAQRIMSPALKDGWKGWHGFRRGLGSNLYSLGVPPKVIQEILRHADVATTETHYIVVDRSEANKAMKKLERAVGKEWAKTKKNDSK